MNSAGITLSQLLASDLNPSTPSNNHETVHNTTPKGLTYRQQVSAINVFSYSTECTLHACPRKFLLEKLTADGSTDETDNIDFLYGHAVGGGVQNYSYTRDIRAAVWESFLSWKGDLAIELLPKKKSFWYAIIAVMKFAAEIDSLLEGWEIAILPNGKPAIELAFRLNLGNGFFYMGHIDAVLWNPITKQFMVLELKTTGFNSINDAQYKNSSQALGYSLIVDVIAAQLNADANNYQVLYCVYKAGQLEWEAIPFVKSRYQRAAWIFDLRLDCSVLKMYRELNHFPIHGESCYSFFRPCEFFGNCDIKSEVDFLMKKEWEATDEENVEGVDFYFHIDELKEIV